MSSNKNIKKTIVNISSKVTFYTLFGYVINIPSKILVAIFLQPVGYGLLSIANLILTYSSYLDLGTFANMRRRISLLLGEDKKEEANDIAAVTAAWMSVTTVFIILALFLLYILGYNFSGLLNPTNIVIIVFLLIANRLRTFLANYCRGFGVFDVIVTKYSVSSILTPLLSVVLAYYFHVSGVLLAKTLASYVILVVFLYYFYKIDSPSILFSFSYNKTILHISESFPLFLRKCLTEIYSTLDILIVTLIFPIYSLGIYAFSKGIFVSLKGAVSSITAVTDRNMLFEISSEGHSDKSIFKKYFESNMICFFMILSILIGISYIFFEIIIANFIPEYTASLEIAQLFFIEVILIKSSGLALGYLNAIGRLRLYNSIYFMGLITKFSSISLLIYYDSISLSAIVMCSIIGSLLIFILSLHFTLTDIYSSRLQSLRISIPFVIILGSLYFLLSEFSSVIDYQQISDLVYYKLIIYLIAIGALTSVIFCAFTLIIFSIFFIKMRPEKQLYSLIQMYIYPNSEKN